MEIWNSCIPFYSLCFEIDLFYVNIKMKINQTEKKSSYFHVFNAITYIIIKYMLQLYLKKKKQAIIGKFDNTIRNIIVD